MTYTIEPPSIAFNAWQPHDEVMNGWEAVAAQRAAEVRVIFWYEKHRNPRWVFPKIVGFPPKWIHFNRVFHYKPSILGYPYFSGNTQVVVWKIFYFHPEIWGRFPIWLIFFRWVETTNQNFESVGSGELWGLTNGSSCRSRPLLSGVFVFCASNKKGKPCAIPPDSFLHRKILMALTCSQYLIDLSSIKMMVGELWSNIHPEMSFECEVHSGWPVNFKYM